MSKQSEKIITEDFKDKVLDRSVNGIYVYDLIKGTNIYINQQYTNLTGYTLDSLYALTDEEFFSLFHPNDQDAISEHMNKVISSQLEEIIEVEYRFKKADGQWMWCFSRDSVFTRDNKGTPTQFMGTFIDISERKMQEAIVQQNQRELERKNKELEQFTYLASHDLQGPLKTIINYVDLIEEEWASKMDSASAKYLQVVANAAGRMKTLINDLLDYSRIGKNQRVIVNCDELIKNILTDLSSLIVEAQANFNITELPTLNGYKTELSILFTNLISNALKFRKKDTPPRIKIWAEEESNQWKFAVQDNGIGIEEAYVERIFVIFQRLHNRKDYEGTGIGLAHCQKIVELHGGKIWVESQLNIGSTFYFTIPRETYK